MAASRDDLYTDSLAESVVTLVIMTVVQRLIGFVRGLLICRVLPPEQLGQWDLILGFLELTAPIVVLGIPGSFGRYVEHYRQRGLLRAFLFRTTATTAVLVVIAVAVFACRPEWMSLLIFGDAAASGAIGWMGVALVAMIAYYFSNALLTSLRRSRTVRRLEFLNSAAFALIAVGLAYGWQADASSVVLAYAAAALVAAAASARAVSRIWSTLPDDAGPLTHASLWRQILPFAMAVWGTNWLANAFELADRYMIVHTGGLAADEALAMVGNYHSARVLPLLLVSVTGTLAAILLPYLSHDWERGRRDAVADQLNFACKLLGLLLTAAAVAMLAAGPLLFRAVLLGKYGGGLAVLPWVLAYCIWFGLARVAQKYLWCAGRVGMAALAWSGGLAVNVALNLVLLPRYGLDGVAWATSAGNLAALGLILWFSRQSGMQISRGLGWILAMPLVLLLPAAAAVAAFAAVTVLALATTQVFSPAEKHRLLDMAHDYWQRFGRQDIPQPSTSE